MKMIQCNKCKKIIQQYGPEALKIHLVRIIVDHATHSMLDMDICAPCFKDLELTSLIKEAPEEPEPLLTALREMIREEIDASN